MGQLHEQGLHLAARPASFICRPDQIAHLAMLDGNKLFLLNTDGTEKSRWRLEQQATLLKLEWMASPPGMPTTAEVLAAIEVAFVNYPNQGKLDLKVPLDHFDELVRSGVVLRDKDGRLTVNI